MLKTFGSAICVFALGAAIALPLSALDTQSRAPDNTAVNKQDRDRNVPTADQGKNDKSDLQLERDIRRDVVRDKSLSTYGHNVKIIASHGHVTLKGAVHSEDEKRAVEEHARKYAGDGNVENQISGKGDQK